MDVFETNEERDIRKAAERKAADEARWAEEVRKAEMADPAECCGRVYHRGSFHGSRCTNKAKFHRQEQLSGWSVDSTIGRITGPTVTRHYCGTHDPVSIREREQKKWDAEKAEREAKYKRQQAQWTRESFISKAVGDLTNEQLIVLAEWLSKTENRQLVFVPQEVQS